MFESFKKTEILKFDMVVEAIKKNRNHELDKELVRFYNRFVGSNYKELSLEGKNFKLTKYDKLKEGEAPKIVVGAYYELPNGKIAYVYGYNSVKRYISYYLDEPDSHSEASFTEIHSWKIRNDLKDFPNAKDPKLPYVFDLYWDIKYESELKALIKEHGEDWVELEGMVEEMNKYNLTSKFFSNKIVDNL